MLNAMLRSVSKSNISATYIGFVDGGSPSGTGTPAGVASNTYTFSNVNIGGPGLIVFGISAEASTSAYSLNSLTVNGNSATQVTNTTFFGGNYATSAIFQNVVASGTTANLVITFSGTVQRTRISVWRVQNYSNATSISSNTATAASGTGLSVTLTSMQVGSAVIGIYTTGTAVSHTWTNLTEKFDSTIAGSSGGADTQASGAVNIILSSSNLLVRTSNSSSSQATILTAAAWI